MTQGQTCGFHTVQVVLELVERVPGSILPHPFAGHVVGGRLLKLQKETLHFGKLKVHVGHKPHTCDRLAVKIGGTRRSFGSLGNQEHRTNGGLTNVEPYKALQAFGQQFAVSITVRKLLFVDPVPDPVPVLEPVPNPVPVVISVPMMILILFVSFYSFCIFLLGQSQF